MNYETDNSSQQSLVNTGSGATDFLSLLISTLVTMANNPNNPKYFFPTFLQGIKLDNGKTLVPFVTGIDMGKVALMQSDASRLVCQAGWAAYNGYGKAVATEPPAIDITSATFNGLNNAQIANYRFDTVTAGMQYPVIFTANLNAYPNYSKLSITPSSFTFGVPCQTNNKAHSESINASGTFQAAFTVPIFTIVVLITLNSNLTATITIPEKFKTSSGEELPGLQLSFGTDGQGKSGKLTVNNIKVTSVSSGSYMQEFCDQFANQAFGESSTTAQIMKLFNQTILGQNIRSSLASGLQDKFNSLISALK